MGKVLTKGVLLFNCILFLNFVYSQEEIPELETDRPDQTETSVVVPFKTLQIETGFVFENTSMDEWDNSVSFNSTLLRYGILNNMELRLGIQYLKVRTTFWNTDSVNTINGLGPIYAGFKIQVTKEKGLLPEIAFIGGMLLPMTAQKELKPSNSAANMRFSVSHTLSDRISFGYNLGAQWDGDSPVPGYFYSLVLSAGLSQKWGIYIEGYGLLPEQGSPENLLDCGITFRLMPNLQLDFSGGVGLSDTAIDHFTGVGLSFRLPE